MGNYKGQYPHERKEGDVLIGQEGLRTEPHNGPAWARVGALVRKAKGWTALKVVAVASRPHISNPMLTVCYGPDDETHGVLEYRHCSDLRPFHPRDDTVHGKNPRCFWPDIYENPYTRMVWASRDYDDQSNQANQGDDIMAKAKRNDLYSWLSEDGKMKMFGIFLTEDSDGKWVMQLADGDKALHVMEESACEKVVPYTVSISSQNSNGATFVTHVKALKGLVAVGDAILSKEGHIGIVTAVNTKNETTEKTLSGRKLLTLDLEAPKATKETEEK